MEMLPATKQMKPMSSWIDEYSRSVGLNNNNKNNNTMPTDGSECKTDDKFLVLRSACTSEVNEFKNCVDQEINCDKLELLTSLASLSPKKEIGTSCDRVAEGICAENQMPVNLTTKAEGDNGKALNNLDSAVELLDYNRNNNKIRSLDDSNFISKVSNYLDNEIFGDNGMSKEEFRVTKVLCTQYTRDERSNQLSLNVRKEVSNNRSPPIVDVIKNSNDNYITYRNSPALEASKSIPYDCNPFPMRATASPREVEKQQQTEATSRSTCRISPIVGNAPLEIVPVSNPSADFFGKQRPDLSQQTRISREFSFDSGCVDADRNASDVERRSVDSSHNSSVCSVRSSDSKSPDSQQKFLYSATNQLSQQQEQCHPLASLRERLCSSEQRHQPTGQNQYHRQHQEQNRQPELQQSQQKRLNGSPVVLQGSPEVPSSTIDDSSSSSLSVERTSPSSGSREQYKCQVCFDVASGFHYGVWTCEGCKAFFKRSLHGPIRYLCPANNNCTIDKLRRKSCQACRLRRCHECGMGASHSRRDSAARNSRKRDKPSTTEISTAHGEDINGGSPRKKEKLSPRVSPDDLQKPWITDGPVIGRQMLEHLLRIEPLSKLNDETSSGNGRRLLITSLIEFTYDQLLNVIEWSKAIPELENLGVLARTNILVNSWAEMVLIGAVWKSLSYSNGIALTPDLILTRDICDMAGIAWLYDRIMPLTQTFRRLQVTHSEMVLLRLTIFLNAEVDAADRFECLNELRKNLNEAWTALLGSSAAMLRISRLLPLMAHIRHCSLTFVGLLEEIRRNRVSAMPGLLVEMLDGDYEALLTSSTAINLEHRALKTVV